jgi:NADH-quinone oxidoreductase subunit L
MEVFIILFPFIAFLLIGLFGRRLGDLLSAIITVLGSALAFIFSIPALLKALNSPFSVKLYDFISFGKETLTLGLYFDPLSAITTSLVCLVSTMIFIYSIGYMENFFGQWTYKFYAYLSFFLFSMLLIVLSDNLLGMFFGWEGVGLASYLLIGYFHQQKYAANSALEAFVMNRIGDWLYLFGIFSIFYLFGSLNLLDIFSKVKEIDPNLLGLAVLLLFGGAVGKSGQVPLHTWLPNAMAGPTPVSALLHSSTMVAAGVYMVARLYPVFESAPQGLKVVALIGGFTALFASLAATSHADIKKIIAFSTMSQLGLMFLALGIGDKNSAMFHLTTHAFFKALLFLSAGSIIHAFHHHARDIYEVGGLKKHMPITYATFFVGALALAGIFPFAGFWSKDLIIASSYEAGFGLGVFVSFVSFLTAYYIFREGFVMFYGPERHKGHFEEEPHEAPSVMLVPMVVLAIGSAVVGFFEGWYMSALKDHKEIHLNIAISSVVIALLGIGLAYLVFVKRSLDPEKLYQSLKPVHTTFKEQFFTERLYHKILAGGYMLYSKVLYATFERQFIDGLVNGSYAVSSALGSLFKGLQQGRVNLYILFLLVGFSLLVLITFLGGR